jgi:hypothetical protein
MWWLAVYQFYFHCNFFFFHSGPSLHPSPSQTISQYLQCTTYLRTTLSALTASKRWRPSNQIECQLKVSIKKWEQLKVECQLNTIPGYKRLGPCQTSSAQSLKLYLLLPRHLLTDFRFFDTFDFIYSNNTISSHSKLFFFALLSCLFN